MTPEGIDHRHLRGDLLKRVSRSFYLSMRFLPASMREPISLGYLLARASDTLADTEGVPVELRRRCLERFRESLRETRPDFAEFYAEVMRDFSPRQSHEGERELLQRLPDLFAWLMDLRGENRDATISVVEEITSGQRWDLERFGDRGILACCEHAGELETYAYQVAGCVGAFWTRVAYANLGDGFAEESDREELLEDGIAMGKGLQLVNILRDLGEDLEQGRCYLPREELRAQGWEDEAAQPPEAALLSVAAEWRRRARGWLGQGVVYASRLRSRRVRFASLLPLLLAEDTLDLIDRDPERGFREKVKVKRSRVYRQMGRAFLFALVNSPRDWKKAGMPPGPGSGK